MLSSKQRKARPEPNLGKESFDLHVSDSAATGNVTQQAFVLELV